MPRCLFAVPVCLVLGSGAAFGQQSAPCGLLADMRQADAALSAFAIYGGDGGARVALAEAFENLRSRAGAAEGSGVAGFDSQFMAAFSISRSEALNLAARGAPAERVLADSVLRQTAERTGRLWVALDCATEEDRAAAAATARAALDGSEVAESPSEAPAGGLGLGGGLRDPSGTGRFANLKDYGGNPWRVNSNPDVWRVLAIFLLVFAASVVLLNWLRAAHHRRSERFPCALEVTLLRGAHRMDARIVELSHLSAKLRLEAPPPRGMQVALVWNGVFVAGRVVWSNQHFAGLNFHQPLPDSACQAMLEAGRVGVPGYIPPAATA